MRPDDWISSPSGVEIPTSPVSPPVSIPAYTRVGLSYFAVVHPHPFLLDSSVDPGLHMYELVPSRYTHLFITFLQSVCSTNYWVPHQSRTLARPARSTRWVPLWAPVGRQSRVTHSQLDICSTAPAASYARHQTSCLTPTPASSNRSHQRPKQTMVVCPEVRRRAFQETHARSDGRRDTCTTKVCVRSR